MFDTALTPVYYERVETPPVRLLDQLPVSPESLQSRAVYREVED